MSAMLSFQFFSGSSIRARNRFLCSSFDKMQEKFYDAGSIAMQMPLQIHDGAVTIMPDRFLVLGRFGNPFTVENTVMHTHD